MLFEYLGSMEACTCHSSEGFQKMCVSEEETVFTVMRSLKKGAILALFYTVFKI